MGLRPPGRAPPSFGYEGIRQSIRDTPVNRLKQPQKVFTMTAICHIFHMFESQSEQLAIGVLRV